MISNLRHGRRGLPLFVVLLITIASPASAATYYVGGSGCSSSGPGTEARPYCTIQQAVTARGGPGTTILVRPGTYLERVAITSAQSGTASQPFVIAAETVARPAMNGLGSPNWTWTAAGAGVHSTPLATGPRVLRVDGTRLQGVFPPLADPTTLAAGRYQYSGGRLYVNFGAAGPAGRLIQVPATTIGFEIRQGAAHVSLSGFEITGATNHAIRIYPTTTGTAPGNITVSGCVVRLGELQGINVTTASDVVIRNNTVEDNGDHGILLQSVTRGVAEGNLCARNARMIETRTAAGIRLFTTDGAVVRNNRATGNEDSGIEFVGCDSGRSIQNRSWRNGNHGFDNLPASSGEVTRNTLHLGDVAHANTFDGISIEGGASGIQIHDCILTNNGATTNRYDLFVLNGSESGLRSGHNIVWNPPSSQQNILFLRNLAYTSLDAFRNAYPSLPYETQSLQLDPAFRDPSAGDFHLRAGSPAIDAANSALADWPAQDAEGRDRFDDPSTIDTGTAPVPYADRGALEYGSGDEPRAAGGCSSSGTIQGPTSVLDVGGHPLREGATLELTVTAPDRFEIDLIDLAGRRVQAVLDEDALSPGVYSYPLDRDVPAGVYFLRLRSGAGPGCRKVILIR